MQEINEILGLKEVKVTLPKDSLAYKYAWGLPELYNIDKRFTTKDSVVIVYTINKDKPELDFSDKEVQSRVDSYLASTILGETVTITTDNIHQVLNKIEHSMYKLSLLGYFSE